MVIKGYKAFNNDMTNRYGSKFEEGKIYEIDGPLSFGNKGNDLHFCENLEDTLKFFDDDRKIAKVTCLGDYYKVDDEQQDYYDMYVTNKLRVDKILTRKEILDYILKEDVFYKVKRFLTFFKLTKEEIEYFKARYAKDKDIINAILYYQEGIKDIYEKEQKRLSGKKM